MAKSNQGNLAEDFSRILENIQGSFKLRMNALGQTIAETHQTLDGFSKDHEKMAKELKSCLKKFKIDLKKQNFERLSDFKPFFKNLQKENNQAAKELKKFLKKYDLERLEDFFKFFKPIQNDIKGMHNAFKGFPQQMNSLRSKPMGFYAGNVSSLRPTQRSTGGVRSPSSFKVEKKRMTKKRKTKRRRK